MTFDLSAAVLASLSPIVETDPAVLLSWADNLERVADAYDSRGCELLATQKRGRAALLREEAAA